MHGQIVHMEWVFYLFLFFFNSFLQAWEIFLVWPFTLETCSQGGFRITPLLQLVYTGLYFLNIFSFFFGSCRRLYYLRTAKTGFLSHFTTADFFCRAPEPLNLSLSDYKLEKNKNSKVLKVSSQYTNFVIPLLRPVISPSISVHWSRQQI